MNLKSLTSIILTYTFLSIFSCAVKKDFYLKEQSSILKAETERASHTIYFLGQSDEVNPNETKLGQLLNVQIEKSGRKSTLLLLGNNSLRQSSIRSDSTQKSMVKRAQLKRRYEFFNNMKGKYYAVFGPHEWANGNRNGMENVRILEEIIEDELIQGNIIQPALGCPGPEEIPIGDHIVLLLIDTQWLFHSWDKPKAEEGCNAESNLDFYVNLDDAIKRNYDKQIVVAGYHSLEGNGPHGGYFPAASHFTPLPVLGSIYVGLRNWLGNPNDLASPKYKVFIKTMKEILAKHKDIIYLSAHEKALEHHEIGNIHILNSGSYSSGVPVGQKNAQFASGKKGFGILLFYENGSCRLEYWGLGESGVELLYQTELYQGWNKEMDKIGITAENIDYRDSLKTSFASDMYTKKQKRPGMLGNNYREEWLAEVHDIPYFDINSEKGGMKILKRGGGQQTKSLRLEAKNEKQYVLRSIEKYPANAVPADLRNTVAVDIVTDQISAAHPYGAFAIPKMAEAAGIYHTNPRLVW